MKINVKGLKIEAAVRLHMDSASEIDERKSASNYDDTCESNSNMKLEGFDVDIPVCVQMEEASLEMDPKEINEMFKNLNRSIKDTIRDEMRLAAAEAKKED